MLREELRFYGRVLLIVAMVFLFFHFHGEKIFQKPPPQVDITGMVDAQVNKKLAEMLPKLTNKERETVIREIRAADAQPAQYTFTAPNLKAADQWGQRTAKKDGADFFTKETTTAPDGSVDAVYKGVHLEKKSYLAVGFTGVEKYGLLESIQNRNRNWVYSLHLKGEELVGQKKSEALKGASIMRILWEK